MKTGGSPISGNHDLDLFGIPFLYIYIPLYGIIWDDHFQWFFMGLTLRSTTWFLNISKKNSPSKKIKNMKWCIYPHQPWFPGHLGFFWGHLPGTHGWHPLWCPVVPWCSGRPCIRCWPSPGSQSWWGGEIAPQPLRSRICRLVKNHRTSHRKTMGKPWGHDGKTMGKWWFHGILMGCTLW